MASHSGSSGVPTARRVADLLDLLTLEEKLSLLAGRDFWHTRAIARLGVPSIRMTDGPHGVTVSGDLSGPATCFPTGVALAATWNPELIQRVGAALGREARAKGNQILLGPAIDIHRSPLNGRNYESYSEDPHLTGKLGAAYVRGVQSVGIGACVKHCTANNQQTEQSTTSSEVDERALREIYLSSWEIILRESRPWAIMTSYNLLNGEWTSQNHHLLTEIIKREWQFEGLIVSDWRGVHSTGAAVAGLDLEMPGPGKYLTEQALTPLLKRGELEPDLIDDKVRRILTAVLKTGLMDDEPSLPEGALNTPEHRDLAGEAAAEAIVLLKNDGDLLPLAQDRHRRLAVIGPNACEARLGGGGSSSTTPFYAISPMDGLRRRCGDAVSITYAEGCSLRGSMPVVPIQHLSGGGAGRGDDESGLWGEYFGHPDLSGPPALERRDPQVDFSWGWSSPGGEVPKDGYSARWNGCLTAPVSGRYQLGLTCEDGEARLYLDGELLLALPGDGGNDGEENFEARYSVASRAVEVVLTAGEARDLRIEYSKRGNRAAIRLEWQTPDHEDGVLHAARIAAQADVAIVFAGLSNQYEGGNNDRRDVVLPGDQDRLISAIARANENTVVVLINGSPVSMNPWIEFVPAVLEAWYPGQEGGNAIAAVLYGQVNPSGRLPDTFPRRLEDNPSHGNYPGADGKVRYAEGVLVGYRHYDTRQIEPLFPFGYGLSYTAFEYENLSLQPQHIGPEDAFEVSVDVTNVGARPGQEVVQLYIGDPESTVVRPVRELRAFEKIHLAPGETTTVTFALGPDALSLYDPPRGWVVEAGVFEISVGAHSRSGLKTWLTVHGDGP